MTRNTLTLLTMCVLAAGTGCHAIDFYTPSLQETVSPELEPPRELSMVSLPPYRIEPPDELYIDVMTLVPRPSYRIGPLDVLQINVLGTPKDKPIRGQYRVEADGTMNLGAPYGVIRVLGLTTEEVEADITRSLQFFLKAPTVSIQLSRSATAEELSGRYRVEPNGVVNLGRCGMVYVTGKTVTEARKAVEAQLAHDFDSPRASVEVLQYSGMSYYIIVDTALLPGEGNMWRLPITGNETVLDAVCKARELSSAMARLSTKTIWVARPAPGDSTPEQILPVDWDAVTHGGITDTNYQILPGDRIYIVDDSVVIMNNVIGKFTSPIERLLNIANLGASTMKGTQTLGREYNNRRRQ